MTMSRETWRILFVLFLIGQMSINLMYTSMVQFTGPIVMIVCVLGLVAMTATKQLQKVWPFTVVLMVTMAAAGVGTFFYYNHFAQMGF